MRRWLAATLDALPALVGLLTGVGLVVTLILVMSRCGAADEYQGWVGRWETVVATAYTPSDPLDDAYHATKGERWRWITADGTTDVRRKPYGVAVPLRRGEPVWAFGTRLIIPTGLGYLDRLRPGNDEVGTDRQFTVDDVGNGRQYFLSEGGHLHIDLRFIDRRDALRWAGPEGKRRIRVFVCARRLPPPPETIVRIPDTNVPIPETIVRIPEPKWPIAEPMSERLVMEAAFPLTELALPGMIIVLGILNRYRRRQSWEPGRA